MNFETEVNNIFITKNYAIDDSENVPITMNWLGHEGLHSIQTLNEGNEEAFQHT